MSRLITRCPACQTMFRVVPDQLRMSAGWVRCGQCQTAFDASAQLQSPAGRPAPLTASPPQSPTPGPLAEATASATTSTVQAPLQDAPPHDTSVWAASAERGLTAPEPGQTSAPEPSALSTPSEFSLPSEPLALEPLAGDPASHAEPRLDEAAVDLLLDDLTWAEPPPSGLPSETAPQEPQGLVSASDEAPLPHTPVPAVRATSAKGRLVWLALASVVLALILALQVVRQERNRIVAALPATETLLQTLCHWAGCELQLLRQADAIVLDSASFLKVRDGVYRLNLTLRNTARWDLAVPAIELTLTDAEDQALLRRVFPAVDLGLPGNRLPAGVEAPVSLLLGIDARELSSRVVGYHALAFYP